MRKIVLILIAIFILVDVKAQVQVRPLPSSGFEFRIRNFVNQLKVVDTHEHLANPSGAKNSKSLDFMLMLNHYADDDIKSAGMSKSVYAKLLTDSLTIMEKWKVIQPYWEASSNTAYNRAVLLAIDSLFGIKNLDETTVPELSEKIKKAYQTDWFNKVLKEKCNIEYAIIDGEMGSFGDSKILKFAKQFDFISIDSKKKIESIAKRQQTEFKTLDDLNAALELDFQAFLKKGYVAVKIAVAYHRILNFDDVKKEKAAEIFNKIITSSPDINFSFDEVKPLQDYMTHRLIGLAGAAKMPIQIHTGLQAGDGNIIQNSNPTHLANLFLKYRDVTFILFHGGYPFGGELATLAKNFRNVYLDMSWLYIISPSYSIRYLHEWLETVPANKIMAFGGDFMNVEGTYGHLLFARQIIANVLVAKVKDGYFAEKEALKIAQMILHDNAIEILKLDKK